jgi:hypothetical protein
MMGDEGMGVVILMVVGRWVNFIGEGGGGVIKVIL